MQYALFEIQGRRLLLDAGEYQALLQGGDIAEAVGPEEASAFHLCHGAYLPQPGTGEAEALEDLLAARGHWLGCLAGGECRTLALEDAQAFKALRTAKALAGRIGPDMRGPALTCFLRYGNLAPAQNLLNRPGVFALKGPVHRLGAEAAGDWKRHIDPDRAVLTAAAIFL